MDNITAPNLEEYVHRRDRLAIALDQDGLDAFIAEPGPTFQYYVNVSQPEWQVWEIRFVNLILTVTRVR